MRSPASSPRTSAGPRASCSPSTARGRWRASRSTTRSPQPARSSRRSRSRTASRCSRTRPSRSSSPASRPRPRTPTRRSAPSRLDPVQGTTLYDALVLSSNSLASETYLGRVIIIVTDGNETRSEASIEEAIAAAQRRGRLRLRRRHREQPVQPAPLQRIRRGDRGELLRRRRHGGARRGLHLDRRGALAHVAPRVRRRPRSRARRSTLKATVGRRDGLHDRSSLPAASVVTRKPQMEGRLPEQFFGTFWGQAAFAAVVGLIIFLAAAFAFASPRSAWLKGRLEPHVATQRRRGTKQAGRERLKIAAGLFHATENALGQVQAVAPAPADARACRPAAPHGRVRLPDARRGPPRRPRSRRADPVGAADRARPARRGRRALSVRLLQGEAACAGPSRTSFPTSS